MSLGRVLRRAAAGVKAFDPLDIGPDAFYRVHDQALAADAAVASLTDLSGHGHHATQATGARQPICKKAVLDGLDVVRFTAASSHWLQVAGYFPGNGGAGNDLTVLAVVKQNSAQGAAVAICSLRRGTSGWQVRYNASASNQWSYGTLGAAPASKADAVTPTNWNLLELVRAGLTASMRHNGSAAVSQAFSAYTAQASTGLCLGGEDTTSGGVPNASFADIDLAALGIWTRQLTQPELDAYENYVRDRYGLTVA